MENGKYNSSYVNISFIYFPYNQSIMILNKCMNHNRDVIRIKKKHDKIYPTIYAFCYLNTKTNIDLYIFYSTKRMIYRENHVFIM